MGDKGGKKDKNKGQKQKVTKQEKKAQEKKDKQQKSTRERNQDSSARRSQFLTKSDAYSRNYRNTKRPTSHCSRPATPAVDG